MAGGAARQARLIELLRCPTCASRLAVGESQAGCGSGHTFSVVDGIPILLSPEMLASDGQYGHQRAYFDTEFSRYSRYRLENWRVSYLRRLAAANSLGGSGAPLVDVGVGGSGYTVIEAARAGRDAIGCDLSLTGLLTARQFAEEAGVAERTCFVCCSAERLPLASATFDVALAIAVLEHVPDDTAAIGELARVLRPGGRAWITAPHALRHIPRIFRPANRRHDRRLGHLRRYEAQELGQRFQRVGLVPVDVQFTGHWVKVLQLAGRAIPHAGLRDRFWWWCERRDLRRSKRARASMQLSIALTRS
jgi:ubiquinone/menaquinone biosynthesis C-methylase UbiE